MRRALVLIHRYAGLAMAPFLVVAGLTGSLLVFMPELDAWLNPRLFVVEAVAPAEPLSRLVATIETRRRELQVTAVLLPDRPGRSVSLFVQPKAGHPPLENDQLFVDPATGRVLGERRYAAFRMDAAHILPFLRRVHYSLHIPGMWGIWLMGGVALAWMLDCFIGFALTLPRGRPFWRKWRPIWAMKRKAGRFRFQLDLHRVNGLWLWPGLFLVALSSVALNLPDLLFRPAVSAVMPTSSTIWEQSPSRPADIAIGFGEALAFAKALAQRRGWTQRPATIFLLRESGQYAVMFNGNRQPGFGASAVLLRASDGGIIRADEAGAGKAGDVVSGLMLPLHTGDVAGLPGRILVCAIGLSVAILSVTGVYIWWRKRLARLIRRRAA